MPRPDLDKLSRFLWALVLVTLPVTSFRYVPFLGEGTYVRPLALYPLALLWPILLVRLVRGRIARPWPGMLTILAGFVLAVLAATAFGATLAPIQLRGADYFGRAIRALLTVGIGIGFFVASAWMNQTEEDLKFSVKWLLAGLVLDLAWGTVQFIGLNRGFRDQLVRVQELFSMRGLVKNKRVSGFAFEPSWFAGQLAALYLPWLVAGLITGFRVLADRKHANLERFASLIVWIEPLLLLAALGGVLVTYSRSGLFTVVAAAALTFLLAGRATMVAVGRWIRDGFARERWTGRLAAIRIAGSRLLIIVLAVAILAGAGAFLESKGYIATLFNSPKEDLFAYAVDVYVGPRVAYAVAALDCFEQSPWLGVGLGASGFYMYHDLPDWVLAGVPEISQQLSPDSNLYPNPKNIYVRLLAETGLPGFVLFTTLYMALLAEALVLLRKTSTLARWLGAAALFTLVAVVLQGISQDSFAMPEMWINLGLMLGAAGSFGSSLPAVPGKDPAFRAPAEELQ